MSRDAGLLARLVLPGMACADIADRGQDVALLEDEAVHVSGAAEKRRRDFALGRACARRALDRLGASAVAVGKGTRGEPLWPEGVTGSITHTRGYAAAVAAPKTSFSAIGVDAEQVEGISPDVAGKLFGPEESAALGGLEAEAWRRAAAIMFSAKEAYYKACLAPSGALSWQSLRVTLTPDGFSISDAGGGEATGRFLVADGLVVTLVSVAA